MKKLGFVASAVVGVLLASGCSVSNSGGGGGKSVTVYSADGLHDGSPNWYAQEFAAFTKKTGIKVNYIEAGSAEVVSRAEQEKSNTQADVLVTLPPFIQQAQSEGLLDSYTSSQDSAIPATLKDPKHQWYAMVNNYVDVIYNKAQGAAPAKWTDLLSSKYSGKLQYSTPGQAGDGTALMIQVIHALGGTSQGLAFLKQLQKNNVGPSSSTGKLTAKVNHGDLLVANGDVQMNMAQSADNPNIAITFLAGADGTKSTFSLPYDIGLVKNAPDKSNGQKLIDFLLGKAAQEQVGPIAQGFPVRSDVTPPPKLQALLTGVKVWQPDWTTLNTQLPQLVSQWQGATGS